MKNKKVKRRAPSIPFYRHGSRTKPESRPRGENNPLSKLKDSDIPKIRELIKSGKRASSIAEDYDVDPGVIHSINRGDTWSHIK